MKIKIFFSGLAIFLFAVGAFSVWKGKNLALDRTQLNENQSKIRLVEAPKETPSIGYDAWKESHTQRTQWPGYYSKDTSGAYYYHMKITGADPSFFDVYNDQYAHDQSRVYYQGYTVEGMNGLYMIVGADVASFKAFWNGYAKDKSHVYFRGSEIVGADPNTFEATGPVDVIYAKDKDHVYFHNQKINDFDAPTFRVLAKYEDGPVFLADKDRVALGPSSRPSGDGGFKFEIRTIDEADPKSFQSLGGLWGKDSQRAFYGTETITIADPETFKVIGSGYAKDKESVYFLATRIPSADAASFQLVEDVQLLFGAYGKDKNSAYKDGQPFSKNDLAYFQKGKLPPSVKSIGGRYYLYQGKVYYFSPPGGGEPTNLNLVLTGVLLSSKEADPATFQVLKDGYARDKEHVYLDGYILTSDPDGSFLILKQPYSKTNDTVFLNHNAIDGALPDSFEILSLGYAKDAQAVFYGDKKVAGADPASFKVLGQGLSSDTDAWGGGQVYYNYARDGNAVFCEGSELTDADLKTFIPKGKNGMPQDKNHSFDGCDIKE